MPDVARSLYPDAAVYGLNRAPNGPATSAVILDALPGRGEPGASLLHLTTHGMLLPEPSVQTRDGVLPLARILEQAHGRAPDAPGGLVITSACVTDVTRTGYDESLTMATAFLAAGATAVIGTRWPVDDDTATALAIRLHHHLRDGHSPAEALRRAQLDLLRPGPALRDSLGPPFAEVDDARLSHPASWAGHVHHGI
jgi:CHAT domain-containing protein